MHLKFNIKILIHNTFKFAIYSFCLETYQQQVEFILEQVTKSHCDLHGLSGITAMTIGQQVGWNVLRLQKLWGLHPFVGTPLKTNMIHPFSQIRSVLGLVHYLTVHVLSIVGVCIYTVLMWGEMADCCEGRSDVLALLTADCATKTYTNLPRATPKHTSTQTKCMMHTWRLIVFIEAGLQDMSIIICAYKLAV